MIPGSNLLNQALRLIKPQVIQHFIFLSRSQNAVRQWVSVYADPVEVKASVQMVPRSRYFFLGLEFQKKYIKIFISADVIDVQRDVSSDKFLINGETYQIESNNDWFFQDGWVSCIAVRIPDQTP